MRVCVCVYVCVCQNSSPIQFMSVSELFTQDVELMFELK